MPSVSGESLSGQITNPTVVGPLARTCPFVPAVPGRVRTRLAVGTQLGSPPGVPSKPVLPLRERMLAACPKWKDWQSPRFGCLRGFHRSSRVLAPVSTSPRGACEASSSPSLGSLPKSVLFSLSCKGLLSGFYQRRLPPSHSQPPQAQLKWAALPLRTMVPALLATFQSPQCCV